MVREAVLLLLLLPITAQVYGDHKGSSAPTACTGGWFGKDCMYRCRCEQDAECGSDGSCPPGRDCLMGYFGPACQYENLLSTFSHNDTPTFARDNDIDTCNEDDRATAVLVKLNDAFSFHWIRIVLKNDGTKLQMAFKIDGVDDCPNERRFVISTTIMDITCHTGRLLSFFTLIGSVAPAICEVYISGGRNVALKQATTSSSTYNASSHSFVAVDGLNQDSTLPCSSTNYEKSPFWQLNYNAPQIITWIKLFSSIYATAFALSRFQMELLDVSNRIVSTHTDTSLNSNFSAEAMVAHGLPAKTLRVSLIKNIAVRGGRLTLCEVETNGETLCPDNTYGLWCDRLCDCSPGEVCHSATGACSVACSNGFFGVNCTQPCGLRCLNNTCYQRLGTCVHCIAGYHGAECDQVCDPGKYGTDCAKTCSNNCVSTCDRYYGGCTCIAGFAGARCDECSYGFYGNSCSSSCSKFCAENCDIITGHCACLEGHHGIYCNECVTGFYGVSCSKPCPHRCKDKACHFETGECFSCIGDHVGAFCEGCPSKFFGNLCRYKCSAQCFNESCDEQNGTCPECLNNYGGPQCIVAPKDRTKIFWFIVPSAIPIGMVTLSVIHFLRKKRNLVEDGEEVRSMKDSMRSSFVSEV